MKEEKETMQHGSYVQYNIKFSRENLKPKNSSCFKVRSVVNIWHVLSSSSSLLLLVQSYLHYVCCDFVHMLV